MRVLNNNYRVIGLKFVTFHVTNLFFVITYDLQKNIVHCATREKNINFASVKFDARAKRG